MIKNLRTRVYMALVNATENGCDMLNSCPKEIAMDLIRFDSDLENEDPTEVAKRVIMWQWEQKEPLQYD